MSYEYDDWDITKIFGDDILPRIEDAFGNITGMTGSCRKDHRKQRSDRSVLQ